MNLPNKLTLLRVVLIPVFLLLFYIEVPHHYLLAFLVFVGASLTDMLDGRIARRDGLVTDFGILMDPLADKLLVMAALLCFVQIGVVHGVVGVIILGREFLVTSIRLVAAGKGNVIAADKWGKFKTIAQMIWLCVGLVHLWVISDVGIAVLSELLGGIFWVFTWIVLALTVASGVNYTLKNRDLFQDA